MRSLEQYRKDGAPIHSPATVEEIPDDEMENVLEVRLDLEMANMHAKLPVRLYTIDPCGHAKFDLLALSLLVNRQHLETEIKFSPMGVRFPVCPTELSSPLAQRLNLRENAIVNTGRTSPLSTSAVAHMHCTFLPSTLLGCTRLPSIAIRIFIKILFGPYPAIENYQEIYDVSIGKVEGHGCMSQLVEALLCVRVVLAFAAFSSIN